MWPRKTRRTLQFQAVPANTWYQMLGQSTSAFYQVLWYQRLCHQGVETCYQRSMYLVPSKVLVTKSWHQRPGTNAWYQVRLKYVVPCTLYHVLGAQYLVTYYLPPSIRYLVPGIWYPVLGTNYLVLGTWCQGTEYLVPCAWCQMFGTYCTWH